MIAAANGASTRVLRSAFQATMPPAGTASRRILRWFLAIVCLALISGCTTNRQPPFETLEAEVRAGQFSQLAAYRTRWLEQADAIERLSRMNELEAQALQLFDLPVRLGAYGSSITEIYSGSLLGQLALAMHYKELNHEEAAQQYGGYVEQIVAATEGNGTETSPYVVLTRHEAEAMIRQQGRTAAGSIYALGAAKDEVRLIVLSAQKDGERLDETHFDLSPTFARIAAARRVNESEYSANLWIAEMARLDDAAAQATLAIELLRIQRHPEQAMQLLRESVSRGNLYARLALAETYLGGVLASDEGEQRQQLVNLAVEQLEQAAAAGSDIAMVQLARVLLAGYQGEGKEESAIHWLQRAVDLHSTTAAIALAQLHLEGRGVEKDQNKALELLAKAGLAGNTDAQFAYAQVQTTSDPPALDEQGQTWLTALAEQHHNAAVMLLTHLQARGKVLPLDIPAAKKLLQEAGRESDDVELINNVAWSLCVSDLSDLRAPRFGLDIMSKMMKANRDTAANNPAYLDTWAACYAAANKFNKAVETQQLALREAERLNAGEREEMLKVLTQHLELFRNEQQVTDETIP